jgi:hypothetical protein
MNNPAPHYFAEVDSACSQLAALHTQVNSIETEFKHGRYEVRLGNLETKVFGAPRR